ncbi:hypothetical protein MUP77_07355 [Candidatus Bathyarchaeota archaeon]|nr:hypothetical protein [Candidatus Bathyarchaeota archaeon]
MTLIVERRPWRTEISVIIADEDLGLSWDEKWSEERIRNIKSNYEKATWVFASGAPS